MARSEGVRRRPTSSNGSAVLDCRVAKFGQRRVKVGADDAKVLRVLRDWRRSAGRRLSGRGSARRCLSQHEDIQAASRRNLSSGTLDGTTVVQVNRNEMTPPSAVLRRQGLNEPRHAASKYQDFGGGPEEVKGDGAPDVARGSSS
jgi:hypothetical protein